MITLDRILPHNIDAEKMVLGAILLQPTVLFEACELITRDDLYLDAHKLILDAFLRLQQADTLIDPLMLKTELQKAGSLEAAGGIAYLFSLTDGMPKGTNVKYYAEIIKETSRRRQTIKLCDYAISRAYEEDEESKEIIENLQLELLKISATQKGGWLKIKDLVDQSYCEIEAIAKRGKLVTGLDTGFPDLNRLTQGLHPGQLVIVAGRPGHGKTSIAMNVIAHAILRHNKRVGLFTIEMSAPEITKRLMYAEAEIESHKVSGGYVSKDEWKRLADTAANLSSTNLSVDESGSLTIMDLRSKAQQLTIAGGLDLIVVDYLQLMHGGSYKNDKNRAQEISTITRGLKQLAKDLSIPVLAMSQLNREVEKESKRKPRLSDLRESGSIEQDADVVLFIWREELRQQTTDNSGTAELIIGKNRNGPVGETIYLEFQKQYSKFISSTKAKPGLEQTHYWDR